MLTGFPEFPEKPGKPELQAWVETFSERAVATGFGFIMRDTIPVELVKLAPRAPIPVPSDAASASVVNAKNLDIAHANAIAKLEYDAKMIEAYNRFASRLQTAMKRTAPMRLEALQKRHEMKDAAGAVIKGSHHGGEMWKELVALLDDACENAVMKKHLKIVESFRDDAAISRARDGCADHAFS